MIARYILVWLWGAALSSGWWATAWWAGVPVENAAGAKIPVLLIPTILGTVVTLAVLISVAAYSAREGK